MVRKLKILFSICMLFIVSSCFEEAVIFDSEPTQNLELQTILMFNNVSCSFDAEIEMLRYYLPNDSISDFAPLVEFQKNSELFFDGVKLKNMVQNTLGAIKINNSYKVEVINNGYKKELDLVFTNLPIIQIISDNKIYDEPKSLARVQINSLVKGEQFSSFVGIELRGRFSRDYDKKSMGFTLWDGMTSEIEVSEGLLDLQNNSDWILGAAFIDPSRIRNLVSFEIWNSLKKTKDDHFGIHSKMVEVFLNNKFQGLYIFSELLNAEFLEVSNEAFLYKGIDWADGATKFETYNPKVSINQFWNGWEQKIPDRRNIINWNPLNELFKIVVDENDETFLRNIQIYFDIDNLMDYYLFLNLTAAIDNTGKNSFLFAKNESTPLQYIPWDLDGSWGILFDGTRIGANQILTNNLFERLLEINPGNYRKKLKVRWIYLRENNFSEEKLTQVFSRYFQKMENSDIIQMENYIWGVKLDIAKEQEYIKSWTKSRLEFLDGYFNML